MVTKVRTLDFLPEIFRTRPNEQFLRGSLDQLVQQPDFKRIQGYIGSKFGYGINQHDKYLVEPSKERTDYQLEPAVIFKKPDTNTAIDLLTYPGFKDSLKLQNSNLNNDSNLFGNEFYSWDNFVDLDKLVNFAQYYWLPNGPEAVTVTNTSLYDRLSIIASPTPSGYAFTSPTTTIDGVNPTITLIRGGVYTFAVNQTSGFWIQSEPGVSGKNSVRSNFSTREVYGVENNGATTGTVTFNVPLSSDQNTWLFSASMDIDVVTTATWESIQGQPVSANITVDGLNINSLVGKTLIFYGTQPGTLGTYNDFYGDDFDTDSFSEATTTDITRHYYTITLAGDDASPVINLTETGLLPDDTNLNILYGTQYSGRKFVKNAYAEILLIPYITAPSDVLWYQNSENPSLVGKIELVDPVTLPVIDVRNILGQKTYVSPNNVTFTNGLKVRFIGNIIPQEFQTGEYYVEGVGTGIELLPVSFFDDPVIIEPYTADYITIARNSFDKNEWSRSNRWFHIDVLNATIKYNLVSPIALAALSNVDNRAKRPIVEFYPNLKLFDSGTLNRENVTYINFNVTDALNQVAGTTSFYPDGTTPLADGDTVIFAGDATLDVRNKIYVAHFSSVNPSSAPVITLSEAPEGLVLYNQQVTVTNGTNYQKLSFYFDGLNWSQSQTKVRKNQPPLFDVFDANNNSFGDKEFYPSSTFSGSTLFEYAPGTGVDDAVLGFPIKYTTGNQFGDIVFNTSLNTDTFEYLYNSVSTTVQVGSGFVFKYQTRDVYERQIGWQTAVGESFQYQVFNKEYTGLTSLPQFTCDVKVKDSSSTPWPTMVVYVDNSRVASDKYAVTTTDSSTTITLNDMVPIGTHVDILIYSDQVTQEGYYQVPFNLDHNPLNAEVTEVALGDIRGHYKSILNNAPGVVGKAFGANNYRDLGNLIPYGTRIIQNSASLVSSGMFLRNVYNFFDSLAYNSLQYTQYKTLLVDIVAKSDYTIVDSTEFILDDVLEKIGSVKSDTNPFFWTDMIPNKNAFSTRSYVFKSSLDTSRFLLSRVYDFTSANYYGILVYLTKRVSGQLQQTLLLKDIDYIVSTTENSLTVTKDLESGDVITIKEYNQTYGSYAPSTPTKLGLYSKFVPEVLYDDSYRYPTYFIQGHDGSYNKLYGTYENGVLSDLRDRVLLEFEKRVFNNLKTSNTIPITYDQVVPGQFRDVGYSLEQYTNLYSVMFLNWVGSNRIDYKSHDYLSSNTYTYNYRGSSYKFNGKKITQGSWRGIYLWLYDTIYPDTKPWEMLGFTIKPSWWDSRYGEMPYTSDNTFMWQDIANGYIWNNGDPYINEQRIRPDLLNILPVDNNGNLKSPFDFLLGTYDISNFSNSWVLGDVAPAEYSYLKSSTWPFDLMRLAALTQPAKFFALGIDVDSYKYSSEFSQYLFNGRYRDYLSLTTVYGNGTSAHSYMNWIIDYINQYEINGTDYVKSLVSNMDVRLTYRLAGFSDKDLLDFFVERGSAASKNNSLLIPEDSLSILLYDNQPDESILYSSLIVQKTSTGYAVYGNSQVKTYFTAFIPSNNGFADSFTVNGNTIYVPKNFYDKTVIIPYGHEFASITDLATFIRGYGLYLNSQGLKFNDVENGLELSWDQMIYETYYWTLTGWDVGSTINVNPSARNIVINKESRVVQPLTIAKDNFILNQNLIPISLNDLYIYRNETEFTVKSLNQGDSLSLLRANLSTIEHVVVFDNETIFNDVIYNLVTGLRQQRIYVKGKKTTEWNGTMNAAGFIINQDNIKEWQQNTKYTKGTIVKFKNDYYIANEVVIIPSTDFDYNKWRKTSYDMVQKGLLPNPSTRAYESTLYYDTVNPNLESDADLLSFSLIGFRQRQYFADANLDDATQVNLYQNMIPVKGTVDSVTRLQGINLQENTLNYDIHENWAIKTSEFGGVMNQNFIEVTLNESQLSGNPSTISLVDRNSVPGIQQEIPLYKIKNYGRPISTTDILPTISQDVPAALPSAGYVNLDDIYQYGFTVNDLPDALIGEVYRNDYLYVADKGSTWQVYTPLSTTALVVSVINNLNGTVTVEFDKPHNLYKNQVMGIINFDTRVDGYHTITSIVNTQSLILSLTLDPGVTLITGSGISFLLQSQRVVTARDIPNLPLLNAEYTTNKVWVDDNVDGNWTVYEKTNNFVDSGFTKVGLTTQKFGSSVAYIPEFGYLVGDSAAGKVYVYAKSDTGAFFVKETISYPGTAFGYAISYSEEIVAITAPGSANGISQIYIYKIPTTNNINGLTLQQVITFGGAIGKSLAISQDSNLLYLGSEDNNIVALFQRDRVLNFTGAGIALAEPTQVKSKSFYCTGDVTSALTEGQRVSFSTLYTNLGITTYYPITELTNEFKVLGDQSGILAYGDQVTFNNVGNGSTNVYTVGSFYVDEEVQLSVTGTFGNGTYAVLFFAAQPAAPFQAGEKIIVAGLTPSSYNGTYTVTLCTTTYVAYVSTATGSMTVAGTVTAPTITVFNTIEYFEVGTNIPINNPIYKITFSQDDIHTVVTSLYDQTTNKTMFLLQDEITYSSPSGSNIFIATDTYSVSGFLSSVLAQSGDKYGFSLATNHDGSKLFVGAPYTNYSTSLPDTGVVFVYDRLIVNIEVQYDQGDGKPFVVRPPFSPTEQTRVYLNGTLLESNQYLVIFGVVVIDDIGMVAGDILTISSVNFVLTSQLYSQDNLSDLRQGELFGYSVSCNKYGSEVIVGVPYDVSNNSQKEGSVIRFTNAGKRFGRLQGVIACNLYEPTYLLLNGQIVNAFTQTPLVNTISTGATSCTISIQAAAGLPSAGVLTLQNTSTGSEQQMGYGSVNYSTGVITFNVPLPTKGGQSQTFTADITNVVLPLGSAANVANAINFTNIDNIRAYSTEDNRLQIFLLKNNLGQTNNKLNISVFNGNYLTMLGFIDYVKSQVIQDPHAQTHTQFGYSVKFNQDDSFVVGAPSSDRYNQTSFDEQYEDQHKDTVFDNNLTTFEDKAFNAGSVYMYDYIVSYDESLTNIGNYLYAQSCNYTATNYGSYPYYGQCVDYNAGVVMVGAPQYNPGSDNGQAWIYENATLVPNWHVYRESAPIVNIDKIQKAQLYNNETNETEVSLDYPDPLQGKLLGVVGENLDFISITDPANYNISDVDNGSIAWSWRQIGKLWFDTSTTKFLDYHQSDMIYNSEYWAAAFPGSTVTVYTWIESDSLPVLYEGPGTVYDPGKYSIVFVTDSNDNLVPKYYYWVRNTNQLHSEIGKSLTDTIVEQYIANPKNSGISFFAPLSTNVFAFYNSKEYINNRSTNFHLGYSTSSNDNSGHQEFQLIRTNFTEDFLFGFVDRNKGYDTPSSLYDRYLDSFSGTDENGAPVPDINLPKLMQSGIGVRPKQSFYYDRLLALQNYLEYANAVVKQYPINELGNITFLYAQGEYFNTTNYWENIYWWAEGYNNTTKARLEVPTYSDLLTLTATEGMIVAVISNPQGKREVYKYENSDWVRIGLEDGTIQFLDSLWNYEKNQIGFGENFFDSTMYDVYPSVETRYIIRALNEQIYVGTLLEHRNKSLTLMFEYIQSESVENQNYLPWLTKTSFVDVNYNVRELTANERFQRDNEGLLEGYINEIKPYHVVLKDFYLTYSRTDVFAGDITDYDLPAVWNDTIGRFVSPQLSFTPADGPYKFDKDNQIWDQYQYANWFSNYGTKFSEIPDTIVTELAEYIDSTQTYMYVKNVNGLPVTGVIRVGAEEISYGAISKLDNKLYGLTRGYNNTVATNHVSHLPIFMDMPAVVVLDSGRDYTSTPNVIAYIDLSKYPAPKREAKLEAVMALDKVVSVNIIDPGEGYVVEPTIVVQPSLEFTSDLSAINFLTNIVRVRGTGFTSGEMVYLTSKSSNGKKILPDGYYYINVLGIVALSVVSNAVLMSFYSNYADSLRGTNKLDFIDPQLLPSDYEVTISIRARAMPSMMGQGVRNIKPTLRFDRTSYRPMVNPWVPNQYYSSPYVSYGNDASTPVKLYDSITYSNMSGTVVPSGGTDATFTVYIVVAGLEYNADIANAGQDYSVGDVVTIPGESLGGSSTNDCIITVDTVDVDGAITSISVTGSPFVSTSGIVINPSLASLQGALLPITDLTSDNSNAVVTVDLSYSGLKPGQIDGTYMYFFTEPSESNEGIYIYDDSLAGGAVIRISRPKFNPDDLNNLYSMYIVDSGTGYTQGDQIRILGSLLGGQNVVNDAIITVTKVNFDTSIFSAIISGSAVGNFGRYYVRVVDAYGTSCDLAIYSDKTQLVPVSYTLFGWNGTNDSFGYLPEQIVNNYSFTYNVGSIVTYAGYIWQCVNANNDNEFNVNNWVILSADDYVLNALDRIEAFYEPTVDMPGKDIQQLMKGITYPNNTYLGNKFAPEDEIPLDFILRSNTFYPRDMEIRGVVYNGTTIVVAGDSSTGSSILIYDSETSLFDSYNISETALGITDLSYTDSLYVLTTANKDQSVWVSDDAVNWFTTGTYSPYDTYGYDFLGYDISGLVIPLGAKNGSLIANNISYAVGGQTILRSANNIVWDEVFNIASNLTQDLKDIIYVDVSGYTGLMAFGKGQEVVSGAGTAAPVIDTCSLIYKSTNGTTWTKLSPTLSTDGIFGATSSSSKVVIVGEAGLVYSSTNTTSWSAGSVSGSPITTNINSVAYGNSMFIAVGDKIGTGATDPGLILKSTDGTNWTQVSSAYFTTENLNKVTFGSDGYFYAAGSNATVLRSLNGVNWENVANIQVADPYYIVQGNDFLFGYGPEELVPGIVTDTLSMYVNTAPGAYWDLDTLDNTNPAVPYWYKHTGFNMKAIVAKPDMDNAVSFANSVVNPMTMSVFIIDDSTQTSYRIYTDLVTNTAVTSTNSPIGYTIDWIAQTITLSSAIPSTKSVMIELYEVGNGEEIVRGNSMIYPLQTDTDGNSMFVFNQSFISVVADPVVYINGVKGEYTINPTTPTQYTITNTADNRLVIKFNTLLSPLTDYVVYSVLDKGSTIRNFSQVLNYSVPETQVYVPAGSETTISLDFDISIGSNEENAVVEVNGKRLLPTTEYSFNTSTNELVLVSSVSGDDVVAITTYNDTSRQWLMTEMYTGIDVYKISYIDSTTDVATVTFAIDPVYLSGQQIYINGVQGATALNGNTYYVDPIIVSGTTYYELYTDSGLLYPVSGTTIGTYITGGTVTTTRFAVPYPTVPAGMDPLTYTEGSRTWVTINGYRLNPDQVVFGEDNQLSVLVPVTSTDEVLITAMITGASPNPMSFNVNVNKYGTPSVYRTNLEDGSWLTQDYTGETDIMYFFDVSHLVENITKTLTVVGSGSDLYILLQANVNQIKEVTVYNVTTLQELSSSEFSLGLVSGASALTFTSGVSLGDSVQVHLTIGDVVELNGERIRFSTISIQNNTISGLTRGVDGTLIAASHPEFSIGYGINDSRKLTTEQYNSIWSSVTIVSDAYYQEIPVEDPLQISTTTTAVFLQSNQTN